MKRREKNKLNFAFRLYVAGASPHSARAQQNLRLLCDRLLAGRHEVDVVDVLKDPRRALADGVLVTPTLIKLRPGAMRTLIGDLSDAPQVIVALGLPALDEKG